MSRARRFVLLCPNYHPRTCGVGDHSMRLALELQRRGFEAQILTRTPATTHPEALSVDVISEDGPTPMVIAARLRRTLLKNRPTDLIIQYTPQMLGAWRWGSPAVLWLAHAAHQAGINTTLLAHELFLPWRRRPDLALGAALLRGQLALLMKICNHVLVTMENRLAEIAPLATLMGLRRLEGVVRVGTNAIPLAPTRRAGRLRLGVFSTLASTKRFDVVLDCFEKVQAVHPHAELVLLGDLGQVDDPRVRGLRAAIAAHPAHNRIRVPGKLGLREIAHEVAEMDIYLFPMITGANTRSGTLPLALGTGLPVVATRSYETDGLFVGGENIAIADAMTGEAFARAVLRLLDDPASADRISRGARTLYDTYLSWERIGDQLLEQI